MSQHVFIATPAYDGKLCFQYVVHLLRAQKLLAQNGIGCSVEFLPGNCYLPLSRNLLVQKFLASKATDLLFIDADMGFEAEGVLNILKFDREIVAGVYPFKTDEEGYPARIICNADKTPKVDPVTGLIEMDGCATGFMRIQRKVFEELSEKGIPKTVQEYDKDMKPCNSYLNFFDCEQVGDRWWGEDYNFCRKWTEIGGKIWCYPNINFSHVGTKAWLGNYHEFLIRQPGGSNQKQEIPFLPIELAKAVL